jgi:hypothetical protein
VSFWQTFSLDHVPSVMASTTITSSAPSAPSTPAARGWTAQPASVPKDSDMPARLAVWFSTATAPSGTG